MIVFEHYSSTSFPVFVLLIDLPNEVVEAAATTVAAVVADIPPLPPPGEIGRTNLFTSLIFLLLIISSPLIVPPDDYKSLCG